MQQLVRSGRDHYDNRNYAEALKCAKSAIEIDSDDENAWLLKGISGSSLIYVGRLNLSFPSLR
jgi:hypothetical protein